MLRDDSEVLANWQIAYRLNPKNVRYQYSSVHVNLSDALEYLSQVSSMLLRNRYSS